MNPKKISTVINIILIVVIAIFTTKTISKVYTATPKEDAKIVKITVEKGENVTQIAKKLYDNEIIKSEQWFKLYGKISGEAVKINAGEFELKQGQSIKSAYRNLQFPIVAEKNITIIEGLTIPQILESIKNDGVKGTEELEIKLQDVAFAEEFEFLNQIPAGRSMEGFIYPNTYRVLEDAKAEEVIRKALSTFDSEILQNYKEKIDKDEYNLFEIITIASIIEREVRGPEDMGKVSDIIRKRLKIGMPLQMDSTVNYITGKDEPSITFTDREIDSPYNTYMYPGLPLGPISNPGKEAIHAALNPTPNDYYFFLTTPEGEVKYGKTVAEHNNNRQYLR